MIKHGPKPVVASCGCWLWCYYCHGYGKLFETQVNAPPLTITTEKKECPECKGKPSKIKHCPAHAINANWEIEEKKKK